MKKADINKRLGRCFELSYEFCLNHSDYKLVHGTITNKFNNVTIHHAWCEKDDMVYDAVQDLELPKIAYEGLYQCKVEYAYSFMEFTDWVNKTRTTGPWEPMSELDLSMYDENRKLKKKTKKAD